MFPHAHIAMIARPPLEDLYEREKSIDQVGREIFDMVLKTASGQKTCAERLGHKEFVPWRVGPVL